MVPSYLATSSAGAPLSINKQVHQAAADTGRITPTPA